MAVSQSSLCGGSREVITATGYPGQNRYSGDRHAAMQHAAFTYVLIGDTLMTHTSTIPTPEAYRQSLTALKELGDHNMEFFGALLEQQKAFATAWWHQNAEPALTLATPTEVNVLLDTSSKLAADNSALLQEHAQLTLETFTKAGEFVAKWYEKHLPNATKMPAAAAAPAPAPTPPPSARAPNISPTKAA
jgi:hypothetical protein